jgi:hypothetical protein
MLNIKNISTGQPERSLVAIALAVFYAPIV